MDAMNDNNTAKKYTRTKRLARALMAAAAITSVSAALAAQDLVNGLLSALSPTAVLASPPPADAHEELPGMGHKFELYGVMVDDRDPLNPTNDVVSAFMTPTSFAWALRRMPPGVRIEAFDNQINLKYYFEGTRSCAGGSPRVVLFIDVDGDGKFDNESAGSVDAAANGHVNPPFNDGCLPGRWYIEDLTDELVGRWEITPGGRIPGIPTYPYTNWDTLEAAVAAIPTHQIIAGKLADDACSFDARACGKAYYDLFTMENRTLENDQDTVQGNNRK